MSPTETPKKILEAAIRIFAEKGLRGARMHRIAEAAGVNQALLHYYFQSKENLYKEALFNAFSNLIRRLAGYLETDSSPEEAFRNTIHAYIDLLQDDPALPRLLVSETLEGGHRLKAVFDRIRVETGITPPNIIIPFVEKGIADGRLRPVDPMQTTVSIIGMCMFYFIARPVIYHVWGMPEDEAAFIERRKDAIVDLVLHGILKPNAETE